MNKKRTVKRLVVTCGVLALMLFAPTNQNTTVDNPFVITAQAAETFSDNWKIDAAGDWRFYHNDGRVVSDAWIHDRGQWYLVDSSGTMRTGIFQSNEGKYYLLDTVRGSGTYGKLLTNGKVYNGITLVCDTNQAYEGALSAESIEALKSLFDFSKAPYIANTKHVEAVDIENEGSSRPSGSVTERPGQSTSENITQENGNGGSNNQQVSNSDREPQNGDVREDGYIYHEIVGWYKPGSTGGGGAGYDWD